jgi:hypothetical protein
VASLKQDGGFIPVQQIIQRLRELDVKVSDGAVGNIGTRLQEDAVIERTEDGWHLLDGAAAAVIAGGRLTGPPAAFEPSDLAAHRREAELAYFAEYGPLSRAQLITLLQQSEWVVAPVNVFLVKADLQRLEAAKLIRRAKPDDPRNWDWVMVKKRGQLKLAK